MFHFIQICSTSLQHRKMQIKISYGPNINVDFEENSPFQEGIMSKMFQRLNKSFFSEPKRAWGSYK